MSSESGLNYQKAAFLTSAANFYQCPEDNGFEVAFAGRSNSGKSSALNTLTHAKLAKTSKTPGRTQLINFFELDEQRRLVDLPGYGYAKVSRKMQKLWQAEMNTYLSKRKCLQGLVLLMDIRHPLKEFDLVILQWTHACRLPVHILLSKADKLSYSQRMQVIQKVEKDIKGCYQSSVQTFSSLKRQGMDELASRLDSFLGV